MKNAFLYVIRYWNKNTFYNVIKNMYCLELFSYSVCMTLCNPINCSIPGFPVLHHLPELAQTHVCWVGDAIQPSHPLLSPSPAFNLSQHQGLFQRVGSLHHMARVLELQPKSFQWMFRIYSKNTSSILNEYIQSIYTMLFLCICVPVIKFNL